MMKKALAFSLGLLLAAAVFALLLDAKIRERLPGPLSAWTPEVSRASESLPPILVIVVGSERGVEHIRSAIAEERIVASSEGAFATIEGRIVAASPDAASAPLNEMNWVEREIEIVRVPTRSRPGQTASGAGETAGGADPARIAELMQKDTLTSAEAHTLLLHMEARGDF